MEYFVPSPDKKKTNINKKKLNFIKFKKGQSPFEVNQIVKGYQATTKTEEIMTHSLQKRNMLLVLDVLSMFV